MFLDLIAAAAVISSQGHAIPQVWGPENGCFSGPAWYQVLGSVPDFDYW
jgi:hypothetical protein